MNYTLRDVGLRFTRRNAPKFKVDEKNPPISTFKHQIAPILARGKLDRMAAKNAEFFVLSNTGDLTQLPRNATAPQYDKVENGPKNAKFHPLNSKLRAFRLWGNLIASMYNTRNSSLFRTD